jgi:hypothetical protein
MAVVRGNTPSRRALARYVVAAVLLLGATVALGLLPAEPAGDARALT